MEDSQDRRPISPPIDAPINAMDLSDLLLFLPHPDGNAGKPDATVTGPAVLVSEEGGSHDVTSTSGRQPVSIMIQPPPEETYPSEHSAIAAVHARTRAHGFNVTKRRAFYTSATPKAVWKRGFDCDRAGRPKCTQHLTDNDRQRPLRGSMRMGCPMKIIVRAASKKEPFGPWMIVHTRNESRLHNHPPSEDARVHPGHRQRAAAATSVAPAASLQEMIQRQTAVGITAGSVRATLLQADPDSFVIPQDIANIKNAARRSELSSMTVMEALFSRMEEDGFYYRYEVDPDTQRLLYLFWAHPGTSAQYRRHPDILGMDCTYKTNKYKLPLLNIVALTGFNTVLPVAQCWLPREREEDYVWAMDIFRQFLVDMDICLPKVILTDRDLASMNAVDQVFVGIPALVCRWHLNKNVLSKTRQVLGQVPVQNPAPGQSKFENTWQTDAFMAAFYLAVDARDEEEFETRKAELRRLSQVLSDYLDNHWWKYKTRFVRAWTDRYQHFGIRDTSFVEGTHAKCKIWLLGCHGDLYKVYLCLLPWWNAAATSTSLLAQRNMVRVPYLIQGNRFAAVTRVISVWALTQTHTLWEIARTTVFKRLDRYQCFGVFRRVHGRPCLHELIAMVESNGQRTLVPQDFDLHWWINRHEAGALPTRIQEPSFDEEPAGARRRRASLASRRSRALPYSTRRDPVLLERVDRNHPADPPAFPGSSSQRDESLVTMLPPSSSVERATVPENAAFQEPNLHARYWGYAG
jgi:hypothetical protein